MDTARHLELLALEGDRLASVPAEHLAAPVPTVEGWTVEDVVRHTGKIHQWVAGVAQLPLDGDVSSVRPPGRAPAPDCVPADGAALAEVTAALTNRPPETPAVAFLGPRTLAWWIRRQVHEVGIHRYDAEAGVAAAGCSPPAPFAVDQAADGVDEWATTFLAVRGNQRFGDFPAELDGVTVHLHGTDPEPPADGSEWLFTFAEGQVAVEATHAKGDVALRGPVEDLLLVLWRRRPLDVLEVFGDRSVAERLLEVATF